MSLIRRILVIFSAFITVQTEQSERSRDLIAYESDDNESFYQKNSRLQASVISIQNNVRLISTCLKLCQVNDSFVQLLNCLALTPFNGARI